MSMTIKAEVKFDVKVVISEAEINKLILGVMGLSLTSVNQRKNEALRDLMLSLKFSNLEDQRIYSERIIEMGFRQTLRGKLLEELTDYLHEGNGSMSNPKITIKG